MSEGKENINRGFFKKLCEKLDINKGKVLSSLLAGFAVPFLIFVCSTFSVYFSNSVELGFGISDFAPFFLLAALAVFAVITIVLLLTRKWLHNLLFALCAGLVICYYVQTFITTVTFRGLPGDGNAPPPAKWWVIADLVLWFAIFAAVIWLSVISSKRKTGRKIMSFAIILVIAMQSVSLLPSAISFASESAKKEDTTQMYLTTENIFEVSEKENIIVFIVDRFDRDYFVELSENNPEVIEKLDGFTYYDDHISKYPRTYPSITYLLTGAENDFSADRSDYFETAYQDSTFFTDLKNNDYKINLYIPYFYTYTNATVFENTVSNISEVDGHSIVSATQFTKNMIKLSSYFWLPDMLKSQTIYSNAFYESVVFEGDAPEYSMNKSSDAKVFADFKKQDSQLRVSRTPLLSCT